MATAGRAPTNGDTGPHRVELMQDEPLFRPIVLTVTAATDSKDNDPSFALDPVYSCSQDSVKTYNITHYD